MNQEYRPFRSPCSIVLWAGSAGEQLPSGVAPLLDSWPAGLQKQVGPHPQTSSTVVPGPASIESRRVSLCHPPRIQVCEGAQKPMQSVLQGSPSPYPSPTPETSNVKKCLPNRSGVFPYQKKSLPPRCVRSSVFTHK